MKGFVTERAPAVSLLQDDLSHALLGVPTSVVVALNAPSCSAARTMTFFLSLLPVVALVAPAVRALPAPAPRNGNVTRDTSSVYSLSGVSVTTYVFSSCHWFSLARECITRN